MHPVHHGTVTVQAENKSASMDKKPTGLQDKGTKHLQQSPPKNCTGAEVLLLQLPRGLEKPQLRTAWRRGPLQQGNRLQRAWLLMTALWLPLEITHCCTTQHGTLAHTSVHRRQYHLAVHAVRHGRRQQSGHCCPAACHTSRSRTAQRA